MNVGSTAHGSSAIRGLLVGIAAAWLLAGCAASTPPSVRKSPAQQTAARRDIERTLNEVFTQWKGTRHRLGGNDASGIDCSGFVQKVFREEFGVALPRTTTAQEGVGTTVRRSELRSGDLVFFRPHSYPRHVGIYVADGEFIHVSSKKGVMRSRLDHDYWKQSYASARRVLR